MMTSGLYRQYGATQGARPGEHHVPHPDGVRGVHAPAVAHVPAAAGLRVPAWVHLLLLSLEHYFPTQIYVLSKLILVITS